MIKSFIFFNCLLLLTANVFAELSQEVNPNYEKPEVLLMMEEQEEIQRNLPFTNNKLAKDWGIKEAAMREKVLLHGDQNALRALETIKRSARNRLNSLEEQQRAYGAAGLYPPSRKALVGPKALKDVDVSVGVGVFSLSIPFSSTYELDEGDRLKLLAGIKDLIDDYESPDVSEGQKYIIAKYLNDYFEFDVNLTDEDFLNTNDGSLIDFKALILEIRKNKGNNLSLDLKELLDTKFSEYIENEVQLIQDQTKEFDKKISLEAKSIRDLVKNVNNKIAFGSQEIINANVKLDYLKKKEIENQVKQRIAEANSVRAVKSLIEFSKTCDVQKSKYDHDECLALREQNQLMDLKLLKLQQVEKRYAFKSGLSLAYDLAVLGKNKELAKDISNTTKVYDSVIKISDLASGLSEKAAMAAVGDVMAMASLSISVVNALSGGVGGKSADEAILEQLRQIRIDIQNLRTQMHGRFDELAAEIQELGLGLNLKLDLVNDNLNVVADDQDYIKERINQNSIMLADMVQIQSNATIMGISRELDSYLNVIDVWGNQDGLAEYYLLSLSKFSSFLKYNSFSGLLWTPEIESNKYHFSSPQALALVSKATQSLNPAENVSYGLVDYLINNSVKNHLGGNCKELNFNNIYLFNLLGSQTLDILRLDLVDDKGQFIGNKYQYVIDNPNSKINKNNLVEFFNTPLNTIKDLNKNAEQCLNNFASIKSNQSTKSKNFNVISYLLNSYKEEVQLQKSKILDALNGEFHLKKMHEFVTSPDSHYFSEKNKFTNVQSKFPERRKRIDLTSFDFSKSFEQQYDKFGKDLVAKYKNVSLCGIYKFREYDSNNQYLIKTNHPSAFRFSDYKPIELPESLIKSIFSNPEIRMALAANLNEFRLCYSPGVGSGLYDYSFLFPYSGKAEKDMKEYEVLTDGHVPSLPALALNIEPIDSPKEFDYKTNKSKHNQKIARQNIITTGIRIFIPTKDVLLSNQLPETKINYIDASESNILKDFKPRMWLFLHHLEFNRYMQSGFKTANWHCEESNLTQFPERCYVEGYRPSDAQIKFWGYSEGHMYGGENFTLYPTLHSPLQWLNLDLEKSNEFREVLKAKGVSVELTKIQQDYKQCYFRTLLGYSTCIFSGEVSRIPEGIRVNWTAANQIESFIRILIPQIAKFKKNITEQQKVDFNMLLDKLLLSPAYLAVNLSIEYPNNLNQLFANLETELEKRDQNFSLLIEMSQQILEINTKDFLNMEVYNELQYYQSLAN